MRALPLAVAAVLALVPAAAGVALEFDQAFDDPAGDVLVRRGPGPGEPVERPGLDVLRLESRQEGERLVHEVRFAAPLDPNATVTIHTQVGATDAVALALSYAHDAKLRPAERTTGMVTRVGGPPVGVPLNVTVDGALVRFAVPVAALPEWVTCFDPAVVAGLREVAEGGTRSFEDAITHDGHTGCAAEVRGSPSPAAGLVALTVAVAAGARTWRGRR